MTKTTAQPKRARQKPEKADLSSEAKSPVNADLTKDQHTKFYTDMVRIRRFEERSLRAYQQGKIAGFLHLYIGQESIAVGCVSLMDENDHIITAYRDHGHALAVGMGMDECMAELYGKATGCSKGKGGSMHYFDPSKRYWGGHGIVGGQTPLGAGLAYALKYKEIEGCALCFLGDGAINQGAFHESLNLAALWDLPVVYIVENNGYSMGTSQERSSAHPDAGIAARAEGYKMNWAHINGESIFDVREGVSAAMKLAKSDSKPSLLEIHTYRYQGHSIADANHKKYRTKEEIEDYRKNHDPVSLYRDYLIDAKLLDEEGVKEIDQAAKAEAEASAQFAEESPFPPEEDILKDVYWEEDNPDQKTSGGRIFFND
ncbi:MAG TPA: pyruvate dehydrogenase (acetyl-transferring) E1 component subunit alpha [Opitutae bacterium]|nr:pyruvate dehydrogenase (acetyl-transferring) E1 component subunit alpha [Opitutaceae bacterium]HCR30402.1 pyruvate dehydrogenase (acetyl-transferring) E1 component subunit alpha [Opitutae bacterium]